MAGDLSGACKPNFISKLSDVLKHRVKYNLMIITSVLNMSKNSADTESALSEVQNQIDVKLYEDPKENQYVYLLSSTGT